MSVYFINHKHSGHVGLFTKKVLTKRQLILQKRQSRPAVRKVRKANSSGAPDKHYGPDAAQEDIDTFEMKRKCSDFIRNLAARVSSQSKVDDIEIMTRGQHINEKWREMRRDYLTASNFGKVVKRRTATPCHNLVKQLLYRTNDLQTPAIIYGRIHEKTASEMYEKEMGVSVEECGLFIPAEHPYLAASPDGLVGSEGLLEIKCFPSISGKLADCTKKNVCYRVADGKVTLKQNHDCYYQVQGQLNITGRGYCDFVMYTDNDFFIERMYRDRNLWNEQMVPKLSAFYHLCILPKLVDGRIPRGMRARDKV
nr:unnamed protein product [Callosobruchus analis]